MSHSFMGALGALLPFLLMISFGMIVPFKIGNSDYAAGDDENNVLFKKLPDKIAGKPAGTLGLLFDIEADITAAGGGNGITGKRLYDFIKRVTLALDEKNRINGVSGGAFRVVEKAMTGLAPLAAADIPAGAGAVTRHWRMLVPFGNYGGERVKDPIISNAQLKAEGALSFEYADATGDLSASANDSITDGAVAVTALCAPMKGGPDSEEHETGAIQNIEEHNYPAPGGEFLAKADRNAYVILLPDDAGDQFAATNITEVQSWINGDQSIVKCPARTVVDQFNRDRKMIDPLFAPEDQADGEADFFPLFWPSIDEGYADVPYGDFRAILTGDLTSVRVLTINRDLVEDSERRRILKLIDPSEAAAKKIDGVSAEGRVPITTKPALGGHLTWAARLRQLLPQSWIMPKK